MTMAIDRDEGIECDGEGEEEEVPFLRPSGLFDTKPKNRGRAIVPNGKDRTVPVVDVVESSRSNKTRSSNGHTSWTRSMKGVAAAGGVVLLVFVASGGTSSLTHREQTTAKIGRDYSQIAGVQDLETEVEFTADRCFNGMRSECKCENPLVGKPRPRQSHWTNKAQQNVQDAKQHAATAGVDVVFYGDSITEGWMGTSYGFPVGKKDGHAKVFQSLFRKQSGARYEGLALGISGDTTTNLLWRLQNGELPDSLHPPVFWILIGTNDFGMEWCSPEMVLIGILRVVEELRLKRPDSTIVLNSLLPRSFHRTKGFVFRSERRLFRRRTKRTPTLYHEIQMVNEQLKRYCDNHTKDHIVYFDMNDYFFVDAHVKESNLKIDKHLMTDFLHPNAAGYKLWGDLIVRELDRWIPAQS